MLALRVAGADAVREYLRAVPATRWSAFRAVVGLMLDERLHMAAANAVFARLLQVKPALPEYIVLRRLKELLDSEQRKRRAR